jgi:hypothetical protein
MEQLQNLVSVLEKQKLSQKDYVASPSSLSFVDGNLVITRDKTPITYTPSKIFHQQVSDVLNIPRGYYDRMKSKSKNLLDDNVNYWLSQEDKNRLIRTFEYKGEDNKARAFLSDRYNMIDNLEVLYEALEALKQTGHHIEIAAAELSESRMFLSVTCPDVEIQAKQLLKDYRLSIDRGTEIISGFELQNSEVGKGRFIIMPRGVVLACNNGLVIEKDALSRVHLGGQLDELEMFKNSAVINANRKLVREQVKHAVKMFLSKQYLQKLVDTFTVMGDKPIQAPIASVIEVVAKDYGITEDRKANILNFFIKGGDTRRIGLVNAITEELQTLSDADLKHDSELIPYTMLTKFDSIEKLALKTKFTTN